MGKLGVTASLNLTARLDDLFQATLLRLNHDTLSTGLAHGCLGTLLLLLGIVQAARLRSIVGFRGAISYLSSRWLGWIIIGTSWSCTSGELFELFFVLIR